MKKEVIAHNTPKSPVSEIFRTLRTNIQFMNTKKKLQTILITSTLPGEGKSWVSSNLAVTFAQAGKKVVLIDADMRKGRQYAIFGVSPRPGLSNYLSGISINENEESSEAIEDYIQETEVENLYLIAAGNIPPNPSELLISPQMVNLLEELKELCDIIILDGTPSELVADALILTRLVDSTVIVTASKETKKENLQKVVTNIQNVGGKIAGVVVNKIPVSHKKYGEAYYYGSTSGANTKKNSIRKTPIQKFNKPTKSKSKDIEEMKKRVRILDNNIERNATNSTLTNINNEVVKNDNDLKNSNIKVENTEDMTLEKTNDILKQINEYLDNEKKNLK